MILTLTMNPAVDKTAEVDTLKVGELNRLNNVMMDAGGKGINVSKTIAQLNGNSIAHGVIAGNSGAFIEEELNRLGIAHDFMKIAGNTRTNLKVLDQDRVLTELNENGPSPSEEELQQLSDHILSSLHSDDILVISGSVPSKVNKDFYYHLILAAKKRQAKVILDADGALFKEGIKAVPHVIKPNRFELCQYFEVEETIDDQGIVALAQRFLAQGVALVAVSMGSDGALFVSKDRAIRVEALNIKAHSSVGAGDAMVAAMAYSFHQGYSLEKLVTLAVATSAGAVMTQGTKPPTKELVESLEKQVKMHEIAI